RVVYVLPVSFFSQSTFLDELWSSSSEEGASGNVRCIPTVPCIGTGLCSFLLRRVASVPIFSARVWFSGGLTGEQQAAGLEPFPQAPGHMSAMSRPCRRGQYRHIVQTIHA
ncbi:unnamed protein product, partial [Laminaria digitata]